MEEVFDDVKTHEFGLSIDEDIHVTMSLYQKMPLDQGST